jgi:hypothetical protein
MADEHHLYVAYIVEEIDSGWDGNSVRVVSTKSDGEAIALVTFSRPSAHFFGPPNDEAFAGHPLASRGLHPYGAFKVESSSWLRTMERRNRVHPHHSPSTYRDRKHFVLTFHDSTFECVAHAYEIQLYRGSVSGVLGMALSMMK